MFINDIIGWIATVLTLSSFVVKEMRLLRILNMSGAILWTIYGFQIGNQPTMFLNGIIVVIHGFWLGKNWWKL